MSQRTGTAETEIEALIQAWTDAVRRHDLPAILAHHADDIVMFDVPPPYDGVRGIDAYRAVWPDFFKWQAGGATFEVLSLDVIEGGQVAFAFALLRCAMAGDAGPQRLRLTLGLRKENGRWTVLHEHHSFSDDRPQ